MVLSFPSLNNSPSKIIDFFPSMLFFVFMCTIFPRSLPCAITEALFSPNSRAAEGKMIFGGNLSAGTLVACTNKRQKKNYDFDPVDQIKAVEKSSGDGVW